nr:hypothetical protein HUO10_004919 [Paraburkholderia busanensis]
MIRRLGTHDAMSLRGHHRGMIVMPGHAGHLRDGRPMRQVPDELTMRNTSMTDGLRVIACHGDGRERLNRKAQYEQHDNEEFAPVRHGHGV